MDISFTYCVKKAELSPAVPDRESSHHQTLMEMLKNGDSENEYEILCPGEEATQAILNDSEFYCKFMPSTDTLSESILLFCGSFPVRMTPLVATSLVRRFTDVRFNWATKTLQSFLEVVCWSSVTYATYSLDGDVLFALEVGMFVGTVMSVCDEVVLHFVRGLALVIRNQPGGRDLLQRLGFDVPKNGKAPTDGEEITLIKNLVFGYLGVVAVRSLWENFHDVKYFALLTACTGVAFVIMAEFFCLWLPTRRVGLTLQLRFTKAGQNWQNHGFRSLFELLCWVLSTIYLYHSSEDFWWAFQLGTLVAVGVSLSSGLDHVADMDMCDVEKNEYGYWEKRALDDPFMVLASRLVKVQHALESFGRALEEEAMIMYENFGE